LIVPAIDILTGGGLVYLFYALALKNREIQALKKPFVLVKHQRRRSYNT
jgi:hypothetical protein